MRDVVTKGSNKGDKSGNQRVNIVPEGTLSVCLCVSVEALAPKRLDGFQRHLGFEVGQRFASTIFFNF